MNPVQAVEQPLGGGEDLVARDRHADQPLEHRPADLADSPPDRRDALDPPAARLGQAEQSERFAGRRGVDDDHVVVIRLDVVGDPQQVAELVHPRQDGHLLGQDLVQPAPAEELGHVALDRRPVASDVVVDVRLLAPEIRCEGGRLRPERAVEGVGQAVGDIGREDDRPMAALGARSAVAAAMLVFPTPPLPV